MDFGKLPDTRGCTSTCYCVIDSLPQFFTQFQGSRLQECYQGAWHLTFASRETQEPVDFKFTLTVSRSDRAADPKGYIYTRR